MNTITFQNPCIRCGKERLIKKKWKEKTINNYGTSVIVHTETACPDKACQKILDERFLKERERTEQMKIAKEERLKTAKEGRLTHKNLSIKSYL